MRSLLTSPSAYVSAYGRLSLFASPSSLSTFDTGTSEKCSSSIRSPGTSQFYTTTHENKKETNRERRKGSSRTHRPLRLTFPPSLNRAPSPAARSTPRGLQLNLYPSGTPSAASGAGSPPQNDVKPTTCLPSARRRASSACAEQWSMPGSSPISFRRRTSAASALGAHGVGRGQQVGEMREEERDVPSVERVHCGRDVGCRHEMFFVRDAHLCDGRVEGRGEQAAVRSAVRIVPSNGDSLHTHLITTSASPTNASMRAEFAMSTSSARALACRATSCAASANELLASEPRSSGQKRGQTKQEGWADAPTTTSMSPVSASSSTAGPATIPLPNTSTRFFLPGTAAAPFSPSA